VIFFFFVVFMGVWQVLSNPHHEKLVVFMGFWQVLSNPHPEMQVQGQHRLSLAWTSCGGQMQWTHRL
jgi:hypothetical protein